MRKITIEVSDETYVRLSATAAEAGLVNVESYLASMLTDEEDVNASDYDVLFTPERMAIIERSRSQIESGEFSDFYEVLSRVKKERNECQDVKSV